VEEGEMFVVNAPELKRSADAGMFASNLLLS